MSRMDDFFKTRNGKIIGAAALLAAGWLAYRGVADTFSDSESVRETRQRPFMCAETRRLFWAEMQPGWGIPIPSPHSGKNTGFSAEFCRWTKDGQIRTDDPIPVLLNKYVNKPGPTFCLDCGRLVVERNPVPQPGQSSKPPPTQSEYEQQRRGGNRKK